MKYKNVAYYVTGWFIYKNEFGSYRKRLPG